MTRHSFTVTNDGENDNTDNDIHTAMTTITITSIFAKRKKHKEINARPQNTDASNRPSGP